MDQDQSSPFEALLAAMRTCEDTYEKTRALCAELDFLIEDNRLLLRKLTLLRPRLNEIGRRV